MISIGYLYQVRYALALLLENENADFQITIERFDDIAFSKDGLPKVMRFIALKTEDGTVKGKLSLYCRTLEVSRQGFYKYLANQDRPWKYQTLADEMLAVKPKRKRVNMISVISHQGRVRFMLYQDTMNQQRLIE